jgi:hypothetical protein
LTLRDRCHKFPSFIRAFIPQILGAAAGLLIIRGLWTPVLGTLTGMAEVWVAFTQPGTQSLAILLAGIGNQPRYDRTGHLVPSMRGSMVGNSFFHRSLPGEAGFRTIS